MDVSPTDENLLYVSTAPLTTSARLFRTTNGGGSFANVTGSLPDRYVMAIEIVPTSPPTVYVALGGFGTSHLFRTTNGGATWSDVGGGLPDVPASAIAVDPDDPDVLYVGMDLGVFVSVDAGGSWEPFFEGMPPTLVNDLRIYAPDRLVRAATHGNGVFEREMVDPSATAVAELASPADSGLRLRLTTNPVRTTGGIDFEVPEAGLVRLEIVDVAGRRVATLVDEARSRGPHTVEVPRNLASGVYFVRLSAPGDVRVTRVVIAR
jgi:photosystem II stability/assembly factor-like uncharacterized protein